MGEKYAVKVNPSSATICWYHRLEERHDFKNTENRGETATANVLSTWGIINITTILRYTSIYLKIFERSYN